MKTPDITPAQIKAAVIAGCATAAAIGLPVSSSTQTALIVVGTAFPSVLVVADAVIRFGRSRLFASAETMDRAEQPKKPV